MAVDITMPQMSDTMNEGTILRWLKQEGDSIQRGDVLAEVATDKADLEIESFHEGTLTQICVPQGTTVKVGSLIAIIGDQGEAAAPRPAAAAQAAPQPAAQQAAPQQTAPQTPVQQPQAAPQPAPRPAPAAPQMNGSAESHEQGSPAYGDDGERIKISPLARNLAKSHGIDYASVEGTGDGGRIVRRDIERAIDAPRAAAPQPAPQPQSARPAVNTPSATASVPTTGRSFEPLSKMRQTIAARMVEATTTIPHFFVTSKVNVDALKRLRASLKPLPQYEGLTYNHLIIKACAMALKVVPRINATFTDNQLVQPHGVNIGIVTAIQDGLLIPVLKAADQLALIDVVGESKALVSRARAGRPKPDDLVGGTFSISNMGLFDVESFTAIISPGQGSILAVAPIQEEPVVVNGQLAVGSVMRLSLSVDHRIIDGVVAGEFLTEVKRLLEDPVLLLA